MGKLKQVWVIASSKSAIAELTCGARTMGARVVLFLAGDADNAVNADAVYYFGELGEKATFLACLPSMVRMAKEQRPDLVLTDLSTNGRIAAAYLAAAMDTNALTDVAELRQEDQTITAQRMVYGGSAFKTERANTPAVACVGAGIFDAAQTDPPGEIIHVPLTYNGGIAFKGKRVRTVQSVNLGAAKKVVSVGRGLGSADQLPLAEAFAAAIGAEIGCSRPVSEEDKWLSKERYVGVSGNMVKPEVYVAAGISGQVQHMAGCNSSGTILAINKDKAAPIFKQCDYGIVGDMHKVLPALTARFNRERQ